MAFLIPDKTEVINGLTIKTKIIPLTAKMNKATGRHAKGAPFRDQRLIGGGTGKARGLTIHNTGAITPATGTTPAEQYSRATYPNQNMGTVRPHYFVDQYEAWQLIEESRVSWCQGETGNVSDISIEIIGPKAEANGAKLAAMIMNRHGFTMANLRTHNYWMGLPDKIVPGAAKNCPFYILPHWAEFKKEVGRLMADYNGTPGTAPSPGQVPYTVRLEAGTPYYAGAAVGTVKGKIEITTNYTIIEERGNFGRLKSGAGWVRLKDDIAGGEKPPVTAIIVPAKFKAWANANNLIRGSTGKAVQAAQAALLIRGYDVVVIDGTYGAVTETQVKAFQRANELTVDGVIGAQTWPVLLS